MQEFKLKIKDLEFETIIGILDFEREKKQRIVLNADFLYEFSKEILDYRLLREFLLKAFEQNFDTLENALMYFKENIPKNFNNIRYFNIQLSKTQIFTDCVVSVCLEYKR
ncbi:dihydroneopterin aldolase [Campylobacter avium]|uniref:dihydroneopterin aldolase n=1 Tax=Campylobacter avium TaxID=522485 RepID=UPI002354768D|nr:dihydroneopterin aldolase [Campylobacter avium]